MLVLNFHLPLFLFSRAGAGRRDCGGSLQSAAVLLVSTPEGREREHDVFFSHLSFRRLTFPERGAGARVFSALDMHTSGSGGRAR